MKLGKSGKGREVVSNKTEEVKIDKDDKIGERKGDLTKLTEKLQNLSKMVHDLLECPDSVPDNEVEKIMLNYSIF